MPNCRTRLIAASNSRQARILMNRGFSLALGALCLTVAAGPIRAGEDKPLHFANDIVPLLSRHGCNAGGCHGRASGQNGFKLSLFGFDPLFYYNALVKE